MKTLWICTITGHILYFKDNFFIFVHLGPFRGNKVLNKLKKIMSHSLQSYIHGYKRVLEGLFLIETLKMGIIYTLHIFLQNIISMKTDIKGPS